MFATTSNLFEAGLGKSRGEPHPGVNVWHLIFAGLNRVTLDRNRSLRLRIVNGRVQQCGGNPLPTVTAVDDETGDRPYR
jgi:hypothetical protein